MTILLQSVAVFERCRGDHTVNEGTKEPIESWVDSHPWLSHLTKKDEDDSVDEVIRSTLDELRFA